MHASPHQVLKNQSFELLSLYQKDRSLQLRNRLVQLNIGLVRQEAYRWLGYSGETFDDLMQIGSLGLINAIERFDLEKGYAFSSFAIPYIRGEIQHYLRDKGTVVRIPRKWQALQNQAAQAIRHLQNELNRKPNDYEVAARLNVTVEEWQQVKLASSNRHLLSLDAPIREDRNGASSLGELLPDARYRSFQLAQEDRIRLQQALEQLEKRTREVLEFVFLQDLTQKETAKKLGISSVTVSRRVRKGLQHLQAIMRPAREG
ncbi:RNA polymerase sigma factor, sigma-70 family [Synechococcus sp. PCC 7335]|uniref:RNA polymerase sigma factor SigF n=1 Tax=Synechococcus sp. (strain ATCC 29403 / PCC 7335) TaxID=91464 RepID=UPI00017EB18E|nr:RNA polymerase sigma factor SigF [Synechococcus sp. PCC 7335]EDX84761.1 RNA polymerase sigma factor, sigma-70 family [Synechococcus sp. PCC 7335]